MRLTSWVARAFTWPHDTAFAEPSFSSFVKQSVCMCASTRHIFVYAHTFIHICIALKRRKSCYVLQESGAHKCSLTMWSFGWCSVCDRLSSTVVVYLYSCTCTFTTHASLRMYVNMCVCKRQRERKSERERLQTNVAIKWWGSIYTGLKLCVIFDSASLLFNFTCCFCFWFVSSFIGLQYFVGVGICDPNRSTISEPVTYQHIHCTNADTQSGD